MSTQRLFDMDDNLSIEFCELKLRILERERYKITRRGGITEYEDRRLDEIDTEIDFWESTIEEINMEYDE